MQHFAISTALDQDSKLASILSPQIPNRCDTKTQTIVSHLLPRSEQTHVRRILMSCYWVSRNVKVDEAGLQAHATQGGESVILKVQFLETRNSAQVVERFQQIPLKVELSKTLRGPQAR